MNCIWALLPCDLWYIWGHTLPKIHLRTHLAKDDGAGADKKKEEGGLGQHWDLKLSRIHSINLYSCLPSKILIFWPGWWERPEKTAVQLRGALLPDSTFEGKAFWDKSWWQLECFSASKRWLPTFFSQWYPLVRERSRQTGAMAKGPPRERRMG